MTAGVVSLLFDAVIVVLLVATIAWAVVLNRKLRVLRGSRDELDRLVARLIEATDRAQSGLDALRIAAETVGETLHTKTGTARAAIDELAYLVERGGDLARRLDDSITAGRSLRPPARSAATEPVSRPIAAQPMEAGPARRAPAVAAPPPHQERLMKALRGVR